MNKAEVLKAANSRIAEERAKVDDYIISASFTLIAAFIVVLTVSEKPTGNAAYLPAGSLSLLVISLLSSLWHRFRYPLRLRQLEVTQVELIEKGADRIATFLETFVQPNPKAMHAIAHAPKLPGTESADPHYRQTRGVIALHLRQIAIDVDAARSAALTKPLGERGSAVLHLIDRFAYRVRYASFGLGVMLFLLASLRILL